MRKKKSIINALTLDQRNIRLREWFKSHDALNLSKVSRSVSYNRGALQHFIDNELQNLGEDVIIKLEAYLSKYDGAHELK